MRGLPIVDQVEPPRERADAARNRVLILDATRKLLRKRRPDQLSIDEVAAAAGVGKGTVYRRFADRSELFRALLDDNERELQEHVRTGLGLRRDACPRQKLLGLLDALAGFVIENAPIVCEAETTRGGRFRAPFQWRQQMVAHAIHRAREGGSVSLLPQLSSSSAADLLLATLSAEVVLRALEESAPSDVREAYRAFFASTLGAPA